jgi:hypothetical protein
MPPGIFLASLLSTVGIAAFTIIKVAGKLAARGQSPHTDERLDELEARVQDLQRELLDTQQRLDFAERLLTSSRDQGRLGG